MIRKRTRRGKQLTDDQGFLDGMDPPAPLSRDSTRRALDELFDCARRYRSTESYLKLLRFTARFRFYSPFNAMLLHVQRPGATFVATPRKWLERYNMLIRPEASPLVILQPMGPVMFVFDVSDTVPMDGAPPLPREVTHPFEVREGRVGRQLPLTMSNAKRDGVVAHERAAGAQGAGSIRRLPRPWQRGEFVTGPKTKRRAVRISIMYEILLNSAHSPEAKYATLVHELGHLYCGHLGSPNVRHWPDRQGLGDELQELEAESVCYLVCERMGLRNPSAEYLSNFVHSSDNMPDISINTAMNVAGLVERMGRSNIPERKAR